jgi:hypothetical protein
LWWNEATEGRILESNPSGAPASVFEILEDLSGQTITRVSLEQWSIRVMFSECSELIVECDWSLANEFGNETDNNVDLGSRTIFELWRLVGAIVTRLEFDYTKPCVWSILTSAGMKLSILGNADKYEDWSLVSANRAYWLVSSGGEITKV